MKPRSQEIYNTLVLLSPAKKHGIIFWLNFKQKPQEISKNLKANGPNTLKNFRRAIKIALKFSKESGSWL